MDDEVMFLQNKKTALTARAPGAGAGEILDSIDETDVWPFAGTFSRLSTAFSDLMYSNHWVTFLNSLSIQIAYFQVGYAWNKNYVWYRLYQVQKTIRENIEKSDDEGTYRVKGIISNPLNNLANAFHILVFFRNWQVFSDPQTSVSYRPTDETKFIIENMTSEDGQPSYAVKLALTHPDWPSWIPMSTINLAFIFPQAAIVTYHALVLFGTIRSGHIFARISISVFIHLKFVLFLANIYAYELDYWRYQVLGCVGGRWPPTRWEVPVPIAETDARTRKGSS